MDLRKYVDCREHAEAGGHCSLRISGTEDEVMEAAFAHAVSAHSLPDTPETEDEIRKMIKDDLDTPDVANGGLSKIKTLSSQIHH